MKHRKSAAAAVQHNQKSHCKWKRKVLTTLLLGFCFRSLVLMMQGQYNGILKLCSESPLLLPPKIAFLFIAWNRLALEMVWDAFFKVDWGESNMIQAERIVLRHALEDPLNKCFVLLSDSGSF